MGDIDGWQVNGKRGYFQHHAYSTGRSRYTCCQKWRDTSKRWVMGRQTLFHYMAHLLSLRLFWLQYKELSYHFISPVRDRFHCCGHVFPLYSCLFVFFRIQANHQHTHSSLCRSRGCPAAFKQGFHLALVLESQHQGEYVDVDWMCSLTVFPEKCITMVHM